jgi:hypothetical protein
MDDNAPVESGDFSGKGIIGNYLPFENFRKRGVSDDGFLESRKNDMAYIGDGNAFPGRQLLFDKGDEVRKGVHPVYISFLKKDRMDRIDKFFFGFFSVPFHNLQA